MSLDPQTISALRAAVRGRLEPDWPLAPHTTYQVGGSAELALLPCDVDDFVAATRTLSQRGVPWQVLGGGSNVLVSDAGVRGAVLITTEMRRIRIQGTTLVTEAGATSHQVAEAARDAGLGGAQFLAWLPGSVGGACLMNARAYGGEMSQVLRRARVLDTELQLCELQLSPDQFSYKRSPFQRRGLVVLEAELGLRPADGDDLQRQMDAIRRRRRSNHEQDHPSCGCVFKNDYSIGISSGALIDRCGLKGFRVGAAEVSRYHANFVFNTGGATARDVLEVVRHVQRTVAQQTGHQLELEVRLLGEWDLQ